MQSWQFYGSFHLMFGFDVMESVSENFSITDHTKFYPAEVCFSGFGQQTITTKKVLTSQSNYQSIIHVKQTLLWRVHSWLFLSQIFPQLFNENSDTRFPSPEGYILFLRLKYFLASFVAVVTNAVGRCQNVENSKIMTVT